MILSELDRICKGVEVIYLFFVAHRLKSDQ